VASGTFRNILTGYLGVLKGVGFFLALVAVSSGLGFLVAWPLWKFATSSRVGYSWFALAAAAGGIVFLVVRAGVRRRTAPPGPPSRRRRHPLLRFALGLLWTIALVIGLYIVLLLAARGLYVAAVPCLAALLILVGYLAFGRRKRPSA
jgi:MprA protease rhombosortase-interaction domain-containing protein